MENRSDDRHSFLEIINFENLRRARTRFMTTLWKRRTLYAFIGGMAGYAYFFFVGCGSGSCPISGNPWTSTIYGAGMGLILTLGERKK